MSKHEYVSKEIPRLKEQLTSILKEKNNKDGIVVSLQGAWGIGKTYFWNEFAKNTWNENQQVYISLFGKHSLDDIKKQIVLKVYDRNKIANFMDNNPIIGKIIETKWGVDASMIANSFTIDTFENIVLCFDDFERISANLSIYEILGFITELKEQHKCKIIIINNNDSLKEQDNLNHQKVLKKKLIKKDKDSALLEEIKYGKLEDDHEMLEKLFITQTNNQDIFNKFSEKIIDYKLYYEPHYSDNLNLIRDEDLMFVNWELIEELLSKVSNVNKQCNIRLMKQLFYKLKLFENSLDNQINEKISNSLVYILFKNIFDEPRLHTDKFDFENIDTLLKFIEDVLKKHYLDQENFSVEIKKINSVINVFDEKNEIYYLTKNIYNKFLYDLSYEDSEFVIEFYNILDEHKDTIVKTISINTFQWYIELMIKIDKQKTVQYKSLYTEAMKKYIDQLVKDNESIPSYKFREESSIIQQDKELENYFQDKKNNIVFEKSSDMNTIIKAMSEPKKKRGYGPDDEELLDSISTQQHTTWMLESAEYLEASFDFITWVKGFAGTKPLKKTYDNMIQAILELKKSPKYKNKLELMTQYFEKN